MLLLVSVILAAGVLLATQRYGTRPLLPLTVLLCLAAVALFDPGVGLAPLMGLIAGFQVERRRSYGQVVVVAALPGAALSLWLLLNQEGAVREQLAGQLTEQLEGMGMQAVEGGYSLRQMIDSVLRVQPAIEFIVLLLTAILAYRVGLWGAQRLGLVLPPARPFHLWRPWEELIWVLIGALVMCLIGAGLLEDLALNAAMVMLILYAVQGLAMVRYYILRLGIARPLELLFYILLFFTLGLALLVLAGLGLLDTWFDWRRLRPAADQEEEA